MLRTVVLLDNREPVIQAFEEIHFGDQIAVKQVDSIDAVLDTMNTDMVALIFVANRLHGVDGLDIVAEIQDKNQGRQPITVILSDETDYLQRIRQMTGAIDDLIRFPFIAEEVAFRVKTLLSEIEEIPRKSISRAAPGFSGLIHEMNLLDLVKSFEIGAKSGIIHMLGNGHKGKVYLREGKVFDAELGPKIGRAAFFTLALWEDGDFRVEFSSVDRVNRLGLSLDDVVDALSGQSMEWQALRSQFNDWGVVLERELEEPDESLDAISKQLIEMIDSSRELQDIIWSSPVSSVEALRAVKQMLERGLIVMKNGGGNVQSTPAGEDSENKSPSNDSTTAQIMDNFVQGILDKNEQVRKHQID